LRRSSDTAVTKVQPLCQACPAIAACDDASLCAHDRV